MATSPDLNDQRCRRVCFLCEPEDGAWVVGAYTLILGIVGVLLLIAVQIWEDYNVFGPIGIVFCVLLFFAGFLLFYGLFRRQVWWLYAWLFIFALNFVSHLVVWSLTLTHLLQFLRDMNSNATDSDASRQKFRVFIVEIGVGAMCLLLSIWSVATILAVRRRMDANRGYIMARPFSFAVRKPRGTDDLSHQTRTRNLSFVNFRKSSTLEPVET